MIVTIHQPEHMPWLGFFHKIARADCFVILDNVQFSKNYFQNRNKIRTHDGWMWVTVPVTRKLKTIIKDVLITENTRWKDKWWSSVSLAYRRSKYLKDYEQGLRHIIASTSSNLCSFNVSLIRYICKSFGIRTDIVLASRLDVKGNGSDLIIDICRKLKADEYLSGISGKEYLRTEDFKKENIKISFQEFHHPIYRQLYEPFEPCMSSIDLLFNHGPMSMDIINGRGVEVIKEVFV